MAVFEEFDFESMNTEEFLDGEDVVSGSGKDENIAMTSDLNGNGVHKYKDPEQLELKSEQHPEERGPDMLSTEELCKTEIKEETPEDGVSGGDFVVDDGFICEFCSRPFKKRHLLSLHRKIHMYRERIKCTECDKSFLSAASLRRHLVIHQGDSGRTFYCEQCGKSFRRSTDVNRHQVIVHSERIKCLQCEKTFYSSNLLKAHLVVTHGEENTEGVKIFQCDQCEKAFIKSSALSRHRLVHTGERNFTCFTCGKAFPQSGHLRTHMLVHSEEKSYACAICPKKFKTQSTLNRHNTLNRHKFGTRYKPEKFHCEVCGFTSNKQGTLTEHMKIHNNEAWNIGLSMMAMVNNQGTLGHQLRGMQESF